MNTKIKLDALQILRAEQFAVEKTIVRALNWSKAQLQDAIYRLIRIGKQIDDLMAKEDSPLRETDPPSEAGSSPSPTPTRSIIFIDLVRTVTNSARSSGE